MAKLKKNALYPIRNIKHHSYVKDIIRYSIDQIAAEDASEWGVIFSARDLRSLHRRETMFNYNDIDNFCHISRGWPRCWKDHKSKRQYLKHIK